MKDFRVSLSVAIFVTFFAVFYAWPVKNHLWYYPFFVNPEEATTVEHRVQNKKEKPHSASAVQIPIFIYHSVRPHLVGESYTQDAYDITPELLDEQLTYLSEHGYTVVSMDEALRFMEQGTSTPISKPVVLTFDDGWENQYKNAYPVLQKHHDIATFYIYTRPIGFKHFLTWPEIKEMQQNGMTIGSHTLSHPYLKGLTEAELWREIFDSKQVLEKELGVPVKHFASPFGYSTPHIENVIHDAGYSSGRTIYKGIYQDDAFGLKGILVSDSIDDFIGMLQK